MTSGRGRPASLPSVQTDKMSYAFPLPAGKKVRMRRQVPGYEA